MGLFSFFKSINPFRHIIDLFRSSTDFDELLEKLEEALLSGDVGFETTDKLISILRDFIKSEKDCTSDKIYKKLVDSIYDIVKIKSEKKEYSADELSAIIVLGVNGVGKTTSIAKIGNLLKNAGNKVIIGAGDTFRAAATSQLQILANRINLDVIAGEEKDSTSTVIYKTLNFAKENNYNIALLDTAGRLHNKQNLMNELGKIDRFINKFTSSDNVERLLVLDATMGQNVFRQLEEFNNILKVTGLIITKADSISKFGFIIGLIDRYNIPIKYVGVGEKITDLQQFDPKEFIEELLQI